jgi:alpha-N-arabinofuranosidase
MEALLSKFPAKVTNFNSWYRFPARTAPIQLAVDEWGIWDIHSNRGKGLFQMEYQYNWSHALGVATFLNLFQRHSSSVGMATWAQTVNVLAPIMADSTGSYRQTIFAPLKAFRDFSGKYTLKPTTISPDMATGIKALDVSSSITDQGKQIFFTIVNRDAAHAINTAIKVDHLPNAFKKGTIRQITWSAGNLNAVNTYGHENAVSMKESRRKISPDHMNALLAHASFTVLVLEQP